MAKKLTKKSEPQKSDAEKWLEKIDRAKRTRKAWYEKFQIPLCYEYWEGNQRPPGVSADNWITVNKIYACLIADLPSLYSQDPYFYVGVKKSFSVNPMDIVLFEQKAAKREAMVNYLKEEISLKQKVRLSIFDAYFQYGIAKVHLYAELTENPNAGKPVLDDSGNPIFGDEDKPVIHPDEIPANKEFRLSRIHPDDFLVDEDAGPLDEDVSWKAHKIRRPLQMVKDDPKYRKEARDVVQGCELKTDDIERIREERKKGGMVYVSESQTTPDICILWELYDLKNRIWMTVAEGCSEFLIEPEPVPPGIGTDPFVDLRFLLRDDSWYPYPLIFPLLDPQREYSDARSKIMVHRKRFNRKYTAYSQGFDNPDESMSRLQNGEDGTLLLTNQPGQMIFPIQDAPLDQQVHTELAYLAHDFDELALGPNQRGTGQGVDSATEAGILEKRAEIREGDKIGTASDFCVQIAKKLDHLVQAHITDDQAIKVEGPTGIIWHEIRVTDYAEIEGEYQYSMDVGATTPQLPEIERAQFNAVLELLISAPQIMQSEPLLKEIFKMYNVSSPIVISELTKIAQQMLSGQIPMPGPRGSAPNQMEQNPAAISGGMASGINNFRGGQQGMV